MTEFLDLHHLLIYWVIWTIGWLLGRTSTKRYKQPPEVTLTDKLAFALAAVQPYVVPDNFAGMYAHRQMIDALKEYRRKE